MAYVTVNVSVTENEMNFTEPPVVASNGVTDVLLKFTFDSDWSAMINKFCSFVREGDYVLTHVPIVNDQCYVPADVLMGKGILYFGCSAIQGSTIYTAAVSRYIKVQGGRGA